jgi:hypothetical protein
MAIRPVLTVLAAVLGLAVAAEARAQLFGSRTLGTSSTQPRSNSSSGSAMGLNSVRDRYFSDYFSDDDFIGTDSGSQRGFVGTQRLFSPGAGQTSTSSRSSTRGRTSTPTVRIEQAPDANRSLPSSTSRGSSRGLYSPRLAVGFGQPEGAPAEVNTSSGQQLAIALTSRLESAFAEDPGRRIEASLADGKATLRGSVSSEHERTLAGLLALFEPGISEVQNQLEVRQPTRPTRSAETTERVFEPSAARTAPAGSPGGP